jgi:tetratricopeptide (TPR) repeat protein
MPVWMLTTLLLGGGCALSADEQRPGPERLQQLLTGEVLYHYHQKDYFSAISQLQKAQDEDLLRQHDADMQVLMARLRLSYGLQDQASTVLNSMQQKELQADAANRAWYELARALFRKGQAAAARQALDNVHGAVPADIAGDVQLLQAHVLSALGEYAQAAQVLADWRGSDEQAPYALYNRGIALMRAGDTPAALNALQQVADMPAAQEELLAIKDKSNLTLGYMLLQQNELEQARARLNKVRLQGPFSNRALLAAGLVAQMQGRDEEALVPWMLLRERVLADPAVQESLLAVPYVKRQLDSPDVAAQHYEQAVASLSRELQTLNQTMQSVRQKETVNQLLAQEDGANPAARYLGDLLVSRVFQETSRGHNDLRSMLDNVDEGLQSIDQLQKALQPPVKAADPAEPDGRRAVSDSSMPRNATADPASPTRAPMQPAPEPGSDDDVVAWQGTGPRRPSSRGMPLLPEVQLPAENSLRALPGSGARGLPGAAEDIGLPPAPEDIGLPLASGSLGLPGAPEDIGLPPASSWRDLDRDDDESPYTEVLARHEQEAAASRRLLRRILRPGKGGATADGMPMDKALGELAAALGHTTARMAELVRKLRATGVRDKLLRERIAALRERILQLRKRIDAALARYEDYARTLALAELAQRRQQLQSYLEHARLELAKSYDSATVK